MSPLDFALEYIGRGWAVVPVPFKSKRPAGDAWQNLRVTEADAPQWFNGQAQNVGVLMGAVSGDLADIDLDCAEAIDAATHVILLGRVLSCTSSAQTPLVHHARSYATPTPLEKK